MAFASVNPLEVPPYQLQPLITSVLEFDDRDLGSSKASIPRPEVTCAHSWGSEIYVGCSDGTLLRFALQASRPGMPEAYSLLSRQSLPTNKPIIEIAVTPSISRALIFSDHQIHFYTLPSLDPVPHQVIRPLRNIVSFAIDEQHVRRPAPSLSDPQQQVEPIDFCVIKRTSISMYSLRERLVLQRDLPNSSGLHCGKRMGRFLCAADRQNFHMIDLHSELMFPLLPIEQVPDASQGGDSIIKPIVVVVSEDEFLMLSSMGNSTMGVFITGNGDPVRGTLEWPSYPDSVCIDYPYVAALLPNRTIEIHSLETQGIVQVVSPSLNASPQFSPTSPNQLDARSLVQSHIGYLVPSAERADKLRLVRIPLIDEAEGNSVEPNLPSNEHPSTSPANAGRPPLFPRSNAMVLYWNSIYSLLPSTLISQADSLLASHRVNDTVDLADQHQRKLLGSSGADDDQAEELRYVYQRLGFYCLTQTLFEDAGRHLLAGEVDPRILVSFFPDLRGNLLRATLTVDVFAGVAEHLPHNRSIEDIVRNYSPHLSPNTHSAPPTAELRRILVGTARDMLATYLRKCRTRRLLDRSSGKVQSPAINAVVDTVLVKILAESEKTTELYTLIDEPNEIVLQEVVEPLEKNGQYSALCKLYEKAGVEEHLLEAWSKVVDRVWTDVDIKDPLNKMAELLNKTTNRALIQEWGVWIIGKNADLGLKILISRDSRRSSKRNDLALLNQIRQFNSSAGARFLEYLVLHKRSQDGDLHEQLAQSCTERLLQSIEDIATAKLWRAKASSYASSSIESSFLSYFALTTPESEQKRVRLETALFLQGSGLYDVEGALKRLEMHHKQLQLETAILHGKLGRHHEAISTLVHDMRDTTSAEAYCTSGGDVIPAKVAQMIGERYGLQPWAALVTGTGARFERSTSQSAVDEGIKRNLLRVLLKVYMSGGVSTAERTSRLLNSQAMNLDVVDVISLVPSDWPLQSMTSFLERSFRRTLHQSHEGKIIKAISASQNLEVFEQTWLFIREQGAVIEEAVDDNDEKGDVAPHELSEKVLQEDSTAVTEIAVDQHKEVLKALNHTNQTDIRTDL